MIDGLTIWLALVGVATIAMLAFDATVWVWRKLRPSDASSSASQSEPSQQGSGSNV